MANNAPNFENDRNTLKPESQSPEFSVIDGQHESEKFDDVSFELDHGKFVEEEGALLEVNDTTRTTFTIRQLASTFPDLGYPSGNEREKRISSVRSFLGQTALIANPKRKEDPKNYNEPHKIKVTRRNYTKEALEGVMESLEEENHPTYQILTQIEEKFGDELSPTAVFNLNRNVIFAAHPKQFRKEVSDRINHDRQVD